MLSGVHPGEQTEVTSLGKSSYYRRIRVTFTSKDDEERRCSVPRKNASTTQA